MTKRSKLGVLLGAGLLTFAVAGMALAAPAPPGISVTKAQSPLTTLPVGGGVVTYTLVVTNSGGVTFHSASVSDANCDATPTFSSSSDGTSSPGGTGSAGFLDTGVAWTFTCTRDLTGQPPGSYTNVAAAFGCTDSSTCNLAAHTVTATSNTVTIAIPAPTPAPTAAPTAGPTAAPTRAPGATGAPAVTAPPTDELGSAGTSGPSDGAWLLVVALGVLLASIVVLAPARTKSRR
jgi:Domain of unknown function DUF11